MIIRKTDRFSRVVAFITAFAIAMLTVTLIHRTTISAEESFIEASDETLDVSDNYESSEDAPESQDPADMEEDTGENSADTGEESDITVEPPADNDIWNDDPFLDIDVDDYNDGIALLDNANITISDDKKRVDANVENAEIVKPSSCAISKADGKPLEVGEEVYDGEVLRFMFNWTIDDSITTAFNDKVLVYDITEQLQGIALYDSIYPLQTADGLEAVYEIQNTTDGKTLLLIEPIKGFQANATGRHGSVRLDGAVKLSGFPAGKTDVTLVFVDATADVTAPSLNNSITPYKSCIELEEVGGKYYQKYQIKLENNGNRDSNAATVLDIPGSALTSSPLEATIEYGNSWDSGYKPKESIAATPNGSGYTFSVDPIKAGGVAYIEYKMEVNTN
ncbi:MAG: hypothetical protein K2N60_11370, partial [Oscillospiraceae bacterium]|nr:hypothetical protein [Oscillospiraceae bacterium]